MKLMNVTTVGQILIDEALPAELRRGKYDIDKKSIRPLLREVIDKYPEQYKDVVHKLMSLGHYAAESTGNSINLSSLVQPPEIKATITRLKQEIQRIAESNLDDDTKESRITGIVGKELGNIQKAIFDHGVSVGSPYAIQAKSGSRGNAGQLQQLIAGDGLVADHRDRTIGVPVLHGYAQGLDPVEYMAGAYGARKGSICLGIGTEVLMADATHKKIEDIKPGDWVMGADKKGKLFPSRVVEHYDNGMQPCYAWRFTQGRSKDVKTVIATETHELLACTYNAHGRKNIQWNFEKLQLASHKKNYHYAVLAPTGTKVTGISEPRALLAGLMLGDGCMAPSVEGRYAFSCADPSLIEDTRTYLSAFNIEFRWCSHCVHTFKNVVKLPRQRNNGHFAKGYLNETKTWLKETLGEKKAHEKNLPHDVWTWDNESIGDLLGGLYSTDGSLYVNKSGQMRISYTSTSYQMLVTIKRLLEIRFGVWGGAVDTRPIEGRQFAVHKLFAFSINHPVAVARFIEQIKLVGKKRRFAEAYVATRERNQPDFVFRLQDKAFLGSVQTYDIEVDNEDHLFCLANGIISGNSTKKSTADAGFFGKQLAQATHRLVVTEQDCGTTNGIPSLGSDNDNIGALLSIGVGKYKAGTIITPSVAKDLGGDDIYVRSPVTCQSHDGVCAKCAGVREKGKLPDIGDNIGMPAAQSLSEKMSQGMLAAKHGGGQVGAAGPSKSGFKYVNQLVQVPTNFQGATPVSSIDGRVKAIEPAPQGGFNVYVEDEQFYVPPDQEVTVKLGEVVEAGDSLSNGTPSPADIVQYKGIGEGRRYFMSALMDGFKRSNISPHRRNVEAVARGLINHVRITDSEGYDGFMPDDVVSFDELSRRWKPREGSQLTPIRQASNMYLEEPTLQYTVGTRVTPRVLEDMRKNKIEQVNVHKAPPPFEPVMIRAMENAMYDRNPMTRIYGSYLHKGFEESIHRARPIEMHGTSFVPSLIEGVDFGKKLKTEGKY